MARLVKRPRLSQVLAFCAEDPIERVFLEDVARRGLGRFAGLREAGRLTALLHLGANLVPSGAGLRGLRRARRRRATRAWSSGRKGAVTELWDVVRDAFPEPLDDRPGQPVYVLERPPREGAERPARRHARRPRRARRGRGRGLPRGGRRRRVRAGPRPLRVAHARADRGGPELALDGGRPHPLQGRGLGVDAGGRAAPAGLGRARAPRAGATASAGWPTSAACSWRRRRRSASSSRPENAAAIALYDSVGMRRTITYRSLIFA